MHTVRGKTPPANGKPPMVIHGRLFYSALKMDEEDINKLA